MFTQFVDDLLADEKQLDLIEQEIQPGDKGERRVSKTLLQLLDEAFDASVFVDRGRKCRSDWTCLLLALKAHVHEYPLGLTEEGRTELLPELEKLARLTKTIQLMDRNTAQGAFSRLTGIFKRFYLRVHGRKDSSPVITLVKRILKVDAEVSSALVQRKIDRRNEKLLSKYTLSWVKLRQAIVRFSTMPHEQEVGTAAYRAAVKQSVLAVMAACGARKVEVLAPMCKFYTFSQYLKKHPDLPIRIGLIDLPGVEKGINPAFLLVQVGVAKDSEQRMNKLIDHDEEHPAYVEPRVVLKPTVHLRAAQVVAMVKRIRQVLGVKKGRDMRYYGALVGTRDYRDAIDSALPIVAKHAEENQWNLGTHIMRKAYAAAAWMFYKDRVTAIRGSPVDRSVFMSGVLAHQGSLDTVLSYANLELQRAPPPKDIKLGDGPLKVAVLERLEDAERELAKLRKLLQEKDEALAKAAAKPGTGEPKRKRRKRRLFASTQERAAYVEAEMKRHGAKAWSKPFSRASGVSWSVWKRYLDDKK